VKRFCSAFLNCGRIGVVIIAVGVFAVGEINSNLSDRRLVVYTSKVKPLSHAAGSEQSVPDHSRNGAGSFLGVLPGTRLRLLLVGLI
jgi:TctA family transporter